MKTGQIAGDCQVPMVRRHSRDLVSECAPDRPVDGLPFAGVDDPSHWPGRGGGGWGGGGAGFCVDRVELKPAAIFAREQRDMALARRMEGVGLRVYSWERPATAPRALEEMECGTRGACF